MPNTNTELKQEQGGKRGRRRGVSLVVWKGNPRAYWRQQKCKQETWYL